MKRALIAFALAVLSVLVQHAPTLASVRWCKNCG